MRIAFDTQSVLKFFLGESGAGEVRDLFESCREGEIKGFMSLVNLTEFYYILYRRNEELAEGKVTSLLGFGLEMVGIRERDIWKKAAGIKADRSIPLADSYAAATAKALDASLAVGHDKHFQNLNLDLIVIGD